MLVEVLLAQQTVTADGQAVVGGVDHDRVLGVAAGLQGRQHPADLFIQVADHPVILAQLVADHLPRPRPCRQRFIPSDHPAVVERMLGHEVPRQRQLDVFRGVHLGVFFWWLPGIMRRGEGGVGEEGLVRLPLPAAEKLDHRIGKDLAGEPSAHPWWGQLAIGPQVPDRHFRVIRHAADEHGFPVLKRPRERFGPVVPLAGPKRDVSAAGEHIGEQWNALEIHGHPPQCAATHQHRPAGLTDRSVN